MNANVTRESYFDTLFRQACGLKPGEKHIKFERPQVTILRTRDKDPEVRKAALKHIDEHLTRHPRAVSAISDLIRDWRKPGNLEQFETVSEHAGECGYPYTKEDYVAAMGNVVCYIRDDSKIPVNILNRIHNALLAAHIHLATTPTLQAKEVVAHRIKQLEN